MPTQNQDTYTLGIPKEYLVFVPALASALAVTYDVGYFSGIDIKFFTFFSLSEHLVFAFEALPIAVLGALMTGLMNVAFRMGLEHRKEHEAGNPKFAWIDNPWLTHITNIGFLLTALVSFRYDYYFNATSAALCGLLLSLLVKWPKYFATDAFIGAYTVFAVGLMTQMLGYDLGRAYITQVKATHRIEVGGSTIDGRLIRTGDRGILFFQLPTKQLELIPWAGLTRIIKIAH